MTNIHHRTLIVLVGASGVGKSTLQRRARSLGHILKRATTRPLQDDAESQEVISLTEQAFLDLKNRGKLLIDFERYGQRYGLPIDEIEKVPNFGIGIIAFPAVVIPEIRKALSEDWDVFSCWLNADNEVVVERLASRKDEATEKTREQREKKKPVDHSKTAHCILDANQDPDKVLEQFTSWVEKLKGNWKGLCKEAVSEADKMREYLETTSHCWCVFGGLAASWYSREAYRDPTDIDIIVDLEQLDEVEISNGWLTQVKPTLLKAEHVELRAKKLTLHAEQRVFIWEFDNDAQKRLNRLRLGNAVFPSSFCRGYYRNEMYSSAWKGSWQVGYSRCNKNAREFPGSIRLGLFKSTSRNLRRTITRSF
jgi:ribose 1,5-bisphosphokinase PhnN